MKKITIIIFCFFTAIMLHAQVPGYQGKRAVLEVQASPSFVGLFQSEFGIPLTYKIHGEYAIKRKKSIGIELRQMNISTNINDIKSNYNNKMLMFLYTKYNRDWALAPYGHYFSYGLGYNIRSAKGLSSVDTTTVIKGNFLSFHLMWGQRYIIAKRLSLNYGFETGIPFNLGDGLTGAGDWALMGFNLNLGLGFIF